MNYPIIFIAQRGNSALHLIGWGKNASPLWNHDFES